MGAHSQLEGTTLPVSSPYAWRKHERDLAYLQLPDLQREIRPTCRTSDLQRGIILIRRTQRLLPLL